MRALARVLSLVLAPCMGALPACGDAAREAPRDGGLDVVVLVADGVDDAAVGLVLGAFCAVQPDGDPAPRARLVSVDGGDVVTRAGVRLGPTAALDAVSTCDVLVIAATPRALSFASERRNAFEHRVRASARWVVALGPDNLALAGARAMPPASASFVVEGRVVASAGGARSGDAALFVIERVFGESAALDAARRAGLDARIDGVRQARLDSGEGAGLRVGERLPQDASVVDERGESRRLLELARATDRVLVVSLLGGASAKAGAGRAGFWCEDTFFELGLLRHAHARFAAEPVRFVAIACPPVHHAEKFGFEAGAFDAAHAAHAAAVERFVVATRELLAAGALPYDDLFFDPTLHLARKDATRPLAADGTGALRAPDEVQAYGTPTTWILDREGKVLAPPFHGNAWEKDRELRYTAHDLEDAIDAALRVTAP